MWRSRSIRHRPDRWCRRASTLDARNAGPPSPANADAAQAGRDGQAPLSITTPGIARRRALPATDACTPMPRQRRQSRQRAPPLVTDGRRRRADAPADSGAGTQPPSPVADRRADTVSRHDRIRASSTPTACRSRLPAPAVAQTPPAPADPCRSRRLAAAGSRSPADAAAARAARPSSRWRRPAACRCRGPGQRLHLEPTPPADATRRRGVRPGPRIGDRHGRLRSHARDLTPSPRRLRSAPADSRRRPARAKSPRHGRRRASPW